ncbi:MAG: hypothetical protein ACOX3Q_04930 [Clostridia bacterium]|jgi:predicted aconitase with swiveling domain|nr:DUF126 domain-containing protein [Clostridiaceae bacterium]
MSKKFQGRVIAKGNLTGSAVVSEDLLNLMAIVDNAVIQHDVKGNILCLPKAGFTKFGGMFLLTACKKGFAPSAMLFSETVDEESASAIVAASNWLGYSLIAIDRLGNEFLDMVKNDTKIEIKDTGEVTIL